MKNKKQIKKDAYLLRKGNLTQLIKYHLHSFKEGKEYADKLEKKKVNVVEKNYDLKPLVAQEVAQDAEVESDEPRFETTNENGFVYTAEEKKKSYDKIKKSEKSRKTKRRIGDFFRNSATYIFSLVSIVVLVGIIYYCFNTGWSTFSWGFISGNNKSEDYKLMSPENQVVTDGDFSYTPKNENEFFSKKWGVAFEDTKKVDGSDDMIISYVAENSPMLKLGQYVEPNNTWKFVPVTVGTSIRSIAGRDENNNRIPTLFARNKAKAGIAQLDKMAKITNAQLSIGGNGIKGPLLATIYFILIGLAIALPLGIGGAIYLSIYAKNNVITRTIRSLIDMISGIPSIVFGLAGAIIFIPMFGGTGNILSGSFTLAAMVLPTIMKNTEEAIKVIPKSMKNASLALGASQTQTVFKIILPNSIPGILTGSLLAIGRIIGESAALVFATGTYINDSPKPNETAASLSVYIWKVMSGENPNYKSAAATAILILFIVLILNLLVKIIAAKFDKFSPKGPKPFYKKMWEKHMKKVKSRKEVRQSIMAETK